jgi:hypothetical protein
MSALRHAGWLCWTESKRAEAKIGISTGTGSVFAFSSFHD